MKSGGRRCVNQNESQLKRICRLARYRIASPARGKLTED